MSRHCSVCEHTSRDDIDRALVEGATIRDVAKRFEQLTSASVHRHRQAHLAATIGKARAASDEARAETLLDHVQQLRARASRILTTAEDAGDAATALRAMREIRGILELLAKLAGELSEAPIVSVSIGSEWPALRASILRALDAFPDARAAVVHAIAHEAIDAR